MSILGDFARCVIPEPMEAPLIRKIEALEAEVARLKAKCDAMQNIVNCASLFEASVDKEDEDDNDVDYENMLALCEAVQRYRTTLNPGATP